MFTIQKVDYLTDHLRELLNHLLSIHHSIDLIDTISKERFFTEEAIANRILTKINNIAFKDNEPHKQLNLELAISFNDAKFHYLFKNDKYMQIMKMYWLPLESKHNFENLRMDYVRNDYSTSLNLNNFIFKLYQQNPKFKSKQ